MAKSPPDTKKNKTVTTDKPRKGGLMGGLRGFMAKLRRAKPAAAPTKTLKPTPQPAAPTVAVPVDDGWRVERPALLELIWGAGWHVPMGEPMMTVLVRAFGLTKEMSVLDLTAGVGGAARSIAKEFKTYVTGLEADADLAAHGAEESKRHGMARTATIKAYDPETFNPDRHYDCVIARELFYRVQDKPRFIKAVAASMKNYGQICWTDFLVEKKDMAHPAVAAWLKREGVGIAPMTLDEVTATWKGLRFDIRIAEDRTEKYTHGMLTSLADFTDFLKGKKIAAATKPLILNEIERCALRVEAMRHGLKLYRFYALRK
jgi:ubiquinone/menaquinone biosynthesis C-methylase UbiE